MNDLNYANRKKVVEGLVSAKNITVVQFTNILLWIEKDDTEIVKEEI